MRRTALAAVALALLWPLLASGAAMAQGQSTLSGRVVNATGAAAGEVSGLEVVLVFQGADGSVEERRATTGPDGWFTMEGLPPETQHGYILRATYRDVLYSLRRSGSLSAEPFTLEVFEPGAGLTDLQILNYTVLVTGVDAGSGTISILEAIQLVNTSDRTFVGGSPETDPMGMLRFSMVSGASGLEVQATLPPGDVYHVETGFALAAPVPPGMHELVFSYDAPYSGSSLSYEPQLALGALSYRVMVPEGMGLAEVVGGKTAEPLVLENKTYTVVEGAGLAPGARLAIRIAGLPQNTLLERAKGFSGSGAVRRGVLPAAVGAGLVALLAYVILRRRPSLAAEGPGETEAGEPGPGEAQGGREAIATAIALLDERFENGEVEEGTYRDQRQELLERFHRTPRGKAGDSPSSGGG